jgi:ATP/ADP translocase
MLRLLTSTTILLTIADHWTTYLCLRQPIEGWVVTEANPIAEMLFESAGLAAGLAIDSLVTLAAVLFLFTTHLFHRHAKVAFLGIISLSTGYAVVHNIGAIVRMGLAPWSGVA